MVVTCTCFSQTCIITAIRREPLTVDILQQGTIASQLEDREAPVPSPSGNLSMGSVLPGPVGRSSQRVLAPESS